MTVGKHTPGPWEYVPSTIHHGPYITSSHGNTIADFYTMTLPTERSTANGGPSRPIHFMHEMADHNAKVAAAAPMLLEACDAAETMLRCLPFVSTNANGTKPGMTTTQALALVRAAIAQATQE